MEVAVSSVTLIPDCTASHGLKQLDKSMLRQFVHSTRTAVLALLWQLAQQIAAFYAFICWLSELGVVFRIQDTVSVGVF